MKASDFDSLAHFTIDERDYKGEYIFYNETVLKNTALESMQLLDALTTYIGKPCILHCTYELNGHAVRSKHKSTTKTAIDFHYKADINFATLCALVKRYFDTYHPNVALGFYPDWKNPGFHIDPRDERVLWTRLDISRKGYRADYYYGEGAIDLVKFALDNK